MNISELKKCVDQLMEIELKAVRDVVKEAKALKDDKHIMLSHSYMKGLERATAIFYTVLESMKDA